MGYVISILVPPVPADDAALWESVSELDALEGPRAPVLQTLHDRLVARFPCIDTLEDFEIDEGVWSDGPLIRNFRHRIATLGVRQVSLVLPYIIECATQLGLVVVDQQTGTLHRPGAPIPEATTFTRPDVQQLLRDGLEPTMTELGFRWARGRYLREWRGGSDGLGWGLSESASGFRVGSFATVRIDAIEELVGPHVGFSKPEYATQAFTINVTGFRAFELGPDTSCRDDETLETFDQVSRYATELAALARDRIDPFWRSLRTPADLQRLPAGWRRFWSSPIQVHDVALAFLCSPLEDQLRIEREALAAFPAGSLYHERLRSLIAELHTRR